VEALLGEGRPITRHRDDLEAWERLVHDVDPALLNPLRDHGRDARALLHRLCEQLPRSTDPPAIGVSLVAASETEDGDATATAGLPHQDRYLNLLEVLIDRAVRVLAALPGRHRLLLHVLTRDVFYKEFGGKGALSTRMLLSFITSHRETWPGSVDVVAHDVSPYTGDLAVGFVVADFTANRIRTVLRSRTSALPVAERASQQRCGLPPRTAAVGRSHLAASGEAYRLVTEGTPPGASPESALPVDSTRRRWACEQAWEWVAAR
jgi:hypothetical protein